MKLNWTKTKYRFRLELSFLFVIILTILFFYLYPQFEKRYDDIKSLLDPDFIVTDIPITYQIVNKPRPPLPAIPSEFEEVELMDDVEIVNEQNTDSLFSVDSSKLAFLYYEDLLPYLGLEKFDSNSLALPEKPLDKYNEYLNNRLIEIFKNKKSFKSRSHVDDYLAKSMGRDPNMLQVDIGSVISATKKLYNSKNKKYINANNIINSQKHWYVLELLWNKKGQTIFDIYANKTVNNKKTIVSLKESIQNLKENGLVFEIESFEKSHYFPAYNPVEMIEIVNRLLAQELPTQQTEVLSSFLNFIILNT